MHEIVTVDCRSEINCYLNARSLLLFGLSYLGYLKQNDNVGHLNSFDEMHMKLPIKAS